MPKLGPLGGFTCPLLPVDLGTSAGSCCLPAVQAAGRLVSHTLPVARSCEVALGRHLPVMVVGIGGSWVCL